ncbi:MAG: RHS repeat-associated core domain-containing protein [Candidatus Binataceae bacterium]
MLYDALNPVQELQSGSPNANLLTGLNIDEYFQRTDSSGAMDFLTDALGSTIGLTNSAGALATHYTYQPFGATMTNGTANANPYQFTGRENDGTGLYFYRARFYSTSYQRFVSQDPLEFGGDNPLLYAYVWQNPVNLRDSLGLICDPGTGMAIGGAVALGLTVGAAWLFPATILDPGIFQLTASLGSFAGRQAYMYFNPDCNPDPPPPNPDDPGPNPDNPAPGAPQPPNGPCA